MQTVDFFFIPWESRKALAYSVICHESEKLSRAEKENRFKMVKPYKCFQNQGHLKCLVVEVIQVVDLLIHSRQCKGT